MAQNVTLGENMWSYGVPTFLTFLLFYVVEHPRQAFLPARCVHFGEVLVSILGTFYTIYFNWDLNQ